MTAQPFSLSGRRALVTGSTRGIGAALATGLARSGAAVVLNGTTEAGVEASVNRLRFEVPGAEVAGAAFDITDDVAVEEAVSAVEREHGPIDILVNNAGIQHVRPIEEFEPERFSFMMRLMLEAPFLLIRAALPAMYERGFGRILNMSSVHGLVASPYKSAYVAAKHGLEGLSKATALEGGAHGVTSNCINPGYVRSPLVEKQIADQAKLHGIGEDEVLSQVLLAEAAVKRLVEPEEVAALAVWLAGPDAGMVSGASYTMDGGWSAR